MSRPSVTLLALVLASGLAGCMKDDPTTEGFVPYSIDDRYPLGVAKGPVSMDVDASSGSLGPRQARAVASLARQAASAGVTPVTVSANAGSKTVANQVVLVLNENGVPANMIHTASHSGGSVRISFVKAHGASRECGVWDKDFTDTNANEPYANHGCAVRANIAAMVADPQDLLVPDAIPPNPSANGAAAADRVNDGAAGRSTSANSNLY